MPSARSGLIARFIAFSSFAVASGALAFAAVGAEGCNVTTGDSDGGDFSFDSGSSGNDSGYSTQGNQACNQCLFQGCSGQWAVCQQSTECIAIYQCATKAGCDQNCVTSCFDAHPNGQKEYTALYTCDQAATCNPSCISPCGTPSDNCGNQGVDSGQTTTDSGTTQPLDCSTCTAQKCVNESGKCGTDSDCDKYSQCVNACADLTCIDGCNSNFAQGKTDSEALANCTTSQCATECGL